jgi:hypothetical protein
MWKFEENTIGSIPDDSCGFIYLIEVESTEYCNKRFYIGKKLFETSSNRNVGIKELKLLKEADKTNWRNGLNYRKLKDGKMQYYRKGKKETWQDYNGSCKDESYKRKVSEGRVVSKTILQFVGNKKMLQYYEDKYMMCNNVLQDENFYNGNIRGRYFKKDFEI